MKMINCINSKQICTSIINQKKNLNMIISLNRNKCKNNTNNRNHKNRYNIIVSIKFKNSHLHLIIQRNLYIKLDVILIQFLKTNLYWISNRINKMKISVQCKVCFFMKLKILCKKKFKENYLMKKLVKKIENFHRNMKKQIIRQKKPN